MESKEQALIKELPRVIRLPRIYDPRGNLSFLQNDDNIVPFHIERVYWIYDVPAGESRGSHAHKEMHALMIALSGSFTVHLFDGHKEFEFILNRPFEGLYIPPGYWRTIDNFASGSVCMVLSSSKYSEDDYIRDYEEFLKIMS